MRKILGAREYLNQVQDGRELLKEPTFSIKRVYLAMLGATQRVSWAKVICHNCAPPKYMFIMWLLMHGRLATCQYLSSIGVSVDDNCSLCEGAVEMLDHLFFRCTLAAKVWKEVWEWCGVNQVAGGWDEEREVLIANSSSNSGKQRLYRCVVTVMVYQLWLERNQRRMQGKQRTTEAIIYECKLLVAWCSLKDKKIAGCLGRRQQYR